MHSKDIRAHGESEQRWYMLDAWREAPLYTDRERAAFARTEAVTKLENNIVPDEVYEEARLQFSEEDLVDLTMAVIVSLVGIVSMWLFVHRQEIITRDNMLNL